jgi:hypothetical protein
MATTVSNINWARVEQMVVPALRDIPPMLSAFSTRVAEQGETIVNDSVYVPLAIDPTVATKTPGTALTGTGGVTGVQVTVNRNRGAGFQFNEGQIGSTMLEKVLAENIAGGVRNCGLDVIDAALALVTATNYGNVEGTDKLTVAYADFGQGDMAELDRIAFDKIKDSARSYGMNGRVAAAILGNSNLSLVFANAGGNFVQTGVVPQLFGMMGWRYSGFPANSEGLASAIFGKSAIAVAIAPPDSLLGSGVGDVIDERIVTDGPSGISCLVRIYGSGAGYIRGEVLLLSGVAKGRDAVVRHVIQ